MVRRLKHIAPLDLSTPTLEDRPVPPGCAVEDLVHEGRHLAYVIQHGTKGASDIVHITPAGHALLGQRLRDLAR